MLRSLIPVAVVACTGVFVPHAGAATIAQSGGTLTYKASEGEQNTVQIGRWGSALLLTDRVAVSDGDGSSGCTASGAVGVCSGITAVELDLGDQNDVACYVTAADPACPMANAEDSWYSEQVSIRSDFETIPMRADGGAGDDRLHGGDGSDRLIGGAGDDRLFGRRGPLDTLEGGTGDDLIEPSAFFRDARCCGPQPDYDDQGVNVLDGGAGSDHLKDSTGFDIVDYSSRTASVVVDFTKFGPLDAAQGEVGEADIIGRVEAVKTGSGADRVVAGGSGPNYYNHQIPLSVSTGDGKDYVRLFQVSRAVDLGKGNDTFIGKDSNAGYEVLGGAGKDKILGSWGDDEIDGGPDDDKIYGYDLDDTITGGSGTNLIKAGWGQDVITSRADGKDKILGEIGVDVIRAADGDSVDSISCGSGHPINGALDPAPQVDAGDAVKGDCFDSR